PRRLPFAVAVLFPWPERTPPTRSVSEAASLTLRVSRRIFLRRGNVRVRWKAGFFPSEIWQGARLRSPMSSATLITNSLSPQSHAQVNLTAPSDRRADVDTKQAQIGALLDELKCEGLLVLAEENFAWLSSGGAARGVVDPGEMPALYFSQE